MVETTKVQLRGKQIQKETKILWIMIEHFFTMQTV